MSETVLPCVLEDREYPFPPYFPNRMYMAIFRLWDTVTAERLAYGLDLPLEVVLKAAEDMGLPEQRQTQLEKWPERGRITTIKNAWHILPYEQLLKVLDMSEAELAAALKDEDFLDAKLGNFKPFCKPIRQEELSAEQRENLSWIKGIVKSNFADMFLGEEPFEFFENSPDGEKSVVIDNDDELRLIYSYCGLYATALDRDIKISYPEEMLKKYRASGVNAIWIPVVLYQITPFPFDESCSEGWQERQQRLKELVALAAEHGIKVYLYLNEPRSMPNAFFDNHPELKGAVEGAYTALCTSDKRVLEYIKNAVTMVCEAVPDLGGFFLINVSENLTHCKSRDSKTESCPKCENTPIEETVAAIITTVYEAAQSVSPSIRTIAWTWSWKYYMSQEQMFKCIDLIPAGVIIQTTSERHKDICIGGIEWQTDEYSMSIPGPSDFSVSVWNYARSKGHEVSAKVQVNDTWECSTMPFLPVFDLIREHIINLKAADVHHLMLSWTLGGYPSVNLKVATECMKNPDEAAYDELLKKEYGEYWQIVKQSASIFSKAFREFPFHIDSLRMGPQNPGPANLLYENPLTKHGFYATMTCFSYDTIDIWRGVYPKDVYVNQLKKLSTIWREGLKLIENMPDCDYKQVAHGGYLLFYSSYLQTEFIMNREGTDYEYLAYIAEEESRAAKQMYDLMVKNSTIGYEAANHYYFYKCQLAEKVICCEYLLEKYRGK
ncbi:MAG: hypothetical protein IKD04_02130 [Clostridia bacterium]|nr:hypothetical protein [Clostridia bacterium]